MKRTESITFRTVLLITVPLTVLLLIAGSVINWQIKFLYDEIVNQNIAIAQARGAQVGAVMNEVTDFSKSLRAIARLRNGTIPEKLKAMENVVKWRPANIDDLMFIAPNGDFTNSTGSTGSVAKRAYFQEMITSGNDYQLNPPVISVLDGAPLFTVIVRLNNDNGDLEGFVSCAVKLETLGRVCKSIAFGKTGYSWIVDNKGLVLSHPNKDMIFKLDLKTADAEMGFKGLAELNEKMQALPLASAGSYGYYTKPDGKRIITLFTKIPNSPDWLLGMSIETEEFFAKQEEMLLMLFGLFGACIVLVVALSIFIARDIAKPIRQAQRAFETLASGNADLTAKIRFTGKNEIGQLVSSFNKFLDKLRDMVVNLKDEQKKLDRISQELKTNTETTAETTIRMSDTIQKVMGQTVRQNDLTNDSSAGVNEIAANIESLDNLIASQSSSIIEASSSIEQMVHNISSISTSMNKMSEEFSHVSSASATGKDKILAMNETILKIVSRSEVLLDVNKTIAEIASMTNLLAMNAAIESAHAGESGKGFAVVADEIRRLAENSSTQSTIINQELTEVQKAISEVSAASVDSQQVFTEMSARIGSTDGLLKEIHRALQEQSEGSREILVALKEMNEISSEVRSGASEMRSGNTTILSAMNGLKTVTDEIGVMMQKLTESSGDIAMKANGLSRMAEGTSEAVTSMEGSIGQFTV